MRVPVALVLLMCAGCASYQTPGAAVKLGELVPADVAASSARDPLPRFPSSFALVRVQAPDYRSASSRGYGDGRFSIVTTQELMTDARLQEISGWPQVATVSMLKTALLPHRFDSLDDLRLAAAKLQADVLLVYSIDTRFEIGGRSYAPESDVSLGAKSVTAAAVKSHASAVLFDVRTGASFGEVGADADLADLAGALGSGEAVDAKRLQAERQAFAAMLANAQTTWSGIVSQAP